MNNPAQSKESINWTCPECGVESKLPRNTRYIQCSGCEIVFKLRWYGGRLDSHSTKRITSDIIDSKLETSVLEECVRRSRRRSLELNEHIRSLEMAKTSERLALLAIFVLICTGIYALFHFTVINRSALFNPGPHEGAIVLVALAAVSMLLVLQVRRAIRVQQVRRLHREKEQVERELEGSEANLFLRGRLAATVPPPPRQPEAAAELDEPEREVAETDIISKFALGRRGKRTRLSLRDEDSD